MLGKVLKYDLRSTKKEFIIIYISIITISLLLSFLINNIDFFGKGGLLSGLLSVLIGIACVGLGIGAGVLSLVTIINLYYKKVFGDEGYLTNCLPVKTYTITLSKLLATAIWSSIALVISTIAIIILVISSLAYAGELETVKYGFSLFYQEMDKLDGSYALLILTILTVVISLVMQAVNFVMSCYLGITFGAKFNGRLKKGLISVASIFIILNIQSVLALAFFNGLTSAINELSGSTSINQILTTFVLISLVTILFNLLLAIVMFFANNYLLKNRLELE